MNRVSLLACVLLAFAAVTASSPLLAQEGKNIEKKAKKKGDG